MLDPTFKLPDVATSVSTALHAPPMALPAHPLTRVAIAAKEPVRTKPMPQSVPILPPIPAPLGPALDPIPIVFAIDPVPLVPPLREEIINPAPIAAPHMELPFVKISILVERDALLHNLGFWGRPISQNPIAVVPDEPLDRIRRFKAWPEEQEIGE